MKNVIQPFAEIVLILFGLTAAASVTDAGIDQKILSLGTTSLISNEKMKDMKIVKSLKDFGLLKKRCY